MQKCHCAKCDVNFDPIPGEMCYGRLCPICGWPLILAEVKKWPGEVIR